MRFSAAALLAPCAIASRRSGVSALARARPPSVANSARVSGFVVSVLFLVLIVWCRYSDNALDAGFFML